MAQADEVRGGHFGQSRSLRGVFGALLLIPWVIFNVGWIKLSSGIFQLA